MPTQKITWTALPKGVHDGVLKLSVCVSPRLDPGAPSGVLGSFPDFWKPAGGHWPGLVANRTFELEFRTGGGTKTAKGKPGWASPPDPKLWEAMFKATTPVKPFEFRDMSARFIHSYSVRTVVEYVKGIYTAAAETTPMQFPQLQQHKDDSSALNLSGLLNTVGGVANNERWKRAPWNPTTLIKDQRQRALDINKYGKYGFASKEEMAFAQVQRFYTRPRKDNPYRESPDPALVGVPHRLAVPKVDFHQMLAALADYPELMRSIGIVIDLDVVIPAGSSLAELIAADAVRVKPAGASEYAPWTLITKNFVARPRPAGDIADGMLSVDNTDLYDLLQVDADSVGLKTLHFAGAMQRVVHGKNLPAPTVNYDTPDDASLPTVRTSGIAIAKANRAYRLADQLFNSGQLNAALASNTPMDLYADDLLRGYRVDVWDNETAKWHSLMQRVGRYVFTEGTHEDIELKDEGYVKGTSATSTNDGIPTDQELYVHENVFQWDGWSLAAGRPGRTIVPKTYDDSGKPLVHQEELVQKPESTAVTDLKMAVTMRPQPGTLPRLRFGRQYRMRARVVDIAGNSVPPAAPPNWAGAPGTWVAMPEADHASPSVVYGRFEPVPSPVLVPRTPFAEGESVERMVIRSNDGVAATAYGEQEYVKEALAGKWYSYHGTNERHVASPKTSQLAAETHGCFEGAMGQGKPHQDAFNIAVKEAGSFLDTSIVDTATGLPTIPATGLALVTPPATPKPHAVLPGSPVGAGEYELKSGDALAAGQYAVHDTDVLTLPYLPDPFARGAALRGLPKTDTTGTIAGGLEKVVVGPGMTEIALKVPFDMEWPKALPFRIQLAEGNGEPEWKSAERILVVPMPKGRWARVAYSCYLGKDPKSGVPDIKLMGLSRWVSDPGTKLEPFAAAGSHWMLTPWRTLEMVHAVQQPLKDPTFYKSEVRKWKIGDTYVDVYGFIDLDAPSTGKIEVLASWFDPLDSLSADAPVDDPGAPGSENFNHNGTVLTLNLDEDAPDRLVIHCSDHDGLYYRQRDLKGFPGVELPAVQDGAGAVLTTIEATKVAEAAVPLKGDVKMTTLAKDGMVLKAGTKGELIKAGMHYDFKAAEKKKPLPPAYAPHCRHEFNDTKHRFVDYQVVSTTRFREYFPTAIVNDPKNITRTGPTWKHVNILSSARPDAPKILYVVPTFGWEEKKIGDQIVSRRCGNAVRVYLERPWYSSGIGELLGVVLRSPGDTVPFGSTDPMKSLVTDLGMDPAWGSEYTKSSLSIGDFPLATHGQSGLTLDEISGHTVRVAGHPVDFDPVRKLWYCDIEIDTGHSYFPFVRMGLARYQPDSIPDAHLSRVVLTDFAQLAPDRVAAVVFDTKDEKKVHVLVSGVYGTSALFRSMVPGTSGNEYLLGSTNDKTKLTTQGASRVVQVAVETKLPGAGPEAPWLPVTPVAGAANTTVVLTPVQKVDHTMVWGGEITLPEAPRKPGGRQYRLVVTESEVIAVDGVPVNFGSGQMLPRGMRVVYADTIELQ